MNAAGSWLWPDLPHILFGRPEYDTLVRQREEHEKFIERAIPGLVEHYGLPDDELSVLCLKRVLAAEAKRDMNVKSHKRVTLSKNVRALVFDLYENKCVVCRREDQPLTIDHIIPLAAGGYNAAVNLQVLCYQCNSDKASMEMTEWLETRKSALMAVAA